MTAKAQFYAQIGLVLLLLPSAAFADPRMAPNVFDGVEYVVTVNPNPRPGWQNGLNSYETRKVCEELMPPGTTPTLCWVRQAIVGGRST